ncbi:MAG: polysaccharide biosynthesis protein [Proteobacteria bacterium]|nr:polysaccharide biosynthesis protein [Pseudomonadota bacterium]
MVWQRLERFLTQARPHRQPLALVIDGIVVALCWHITYLFRLGFERWQSARPGYDAWVITGIVAVYLIVFVIAGVPRSMWRFAGFGEIKRLTVACLVAGLVSAVVVLMAGLREVPRAVLALHPVVSLMGLCIARIGYRMLYEHMRGRLNGEATGTRRALVLGAGDAGRLLLAGIQHQGWVVVGLLDDDPTKQRTRIANVPVLGPLSAVKELADRHAATHVVLAMPGVPVVQRRRAIDLAAGTGLPVLTVPSAQELISGGTVSRVRDIEPGDLLGREPVQLDEAGIAETLSGKTVLITGAGGSIGSELCRQVARYGPQRIVLYELSEFSLYNIEQELTERFPHLVLARLIGDVKDLEHLRRTYAHWKPHVVFHAAAYKHVPLMEEENAWAAVRNNALGTQYAAQAAAESGVERFVLISTDKAVNPTNVMGASKRLAEMLLSRQAAVSKAAGQTTRFMAVRFGNVLGSSGSVIPKFKEQIARGGPVTVTHPDITRYFMTIPEAARLVLQAAAIGESGQVLVLDMGEPVRIVDLARDMIRLAGHAPGEIRIEFTGLRAGEKLYEELLAAADTSVATSIPHVRIALLDGAPPDTDVVRPTSSLLDPGDADVRRLLRDYVPEYRPATR